MLVFNQVSKTYKGKKHASIENASFNIQQNEFVFLIGPSGAGKSSILKLAIREERADKGNIIILDNDITNIKDNALLNLRRSIGVIFQDYKLLETHTILENLLFVLTVINYPKRKTKTAIHDVLDFVGLSDKANSYPSTLSGGEQQRAAIARACITRPKILLADEPTGNLDPENTAITIKLLNNINLTGTTVIMSTHDTNIVNYMRKRVITIEDGRITSDHHKGVYAKY